MSKRILGVMLAGLIVLFAWQAQRSLAAPTQAQRAKARAAGSALKKAQHLAKAKKYKPAGEALKEAQAAIGELGSEADAAPLVAPLYQQLASLHGDLELQGVTLAPLPPEPKGAPADSPPANPGRPTAGGAKPLAGGAAPTGEISFTKQVAPVLVAKCGGCHVRGRKGDVSMLSYAALMQGAKGLAIVSPKSGEGSRIIEVIREGSMPKGGGTVSPDEVALLSKWIDQGAKLDAGGNPAANIADPNLVPGAPRADAAKIEVAMATGAESVHFALEIAPVLMTQCYGCHGEGRQAAARFDMDGFKDLLRGGESGEPINPGKPDTSLLMQKLRGTAAEGVRMPKDRPPLSDEQIAKFAKWISEGAKFDGYDPNTPLKEVAAVAHAEKITPEELAKERELLGAHNWKLVLPDGGADREETENFVVFGNTGPESLKEVAKIAEAQGAKLKKLLKLPPGPLMKGRTNVYVFDKKYDYGEVGRMLEGRELPSESRGHWRYTIVDSYICVVPPKNDEYSLSSMIGQQLAGVVLASQGHMPRWLAEGASRVYAIKLDPKDPRYKQWDDEARDAIAGGVKPEGFLTGSGPDNDLVAFTFVKFLMTDSGRYQRLMSAVRANKPFDAAFQQAYGGTPAQVVGAWAGQGRY